MSSSRIDGKHDAATPTASDAVLPGPEPREVKEKQHEAVRLQPSANPEVLRDAAKGIEPVPTPVAARPTGPASHGVSLRGGNSHAINLPSERGWFDRAAGALKSAGGAVVDHATDMAGEANDAMKTAGEVWGSREPSDVTLDARREASGLVRDGVSALAGHVLPDKAAEVLGEVAGNHAGFQLAPIMAAARFAVDTAKGGAHLVEKAQDVVQGDAPMPTPGEVVAGAVAGTADYVGNTIDSGVEAVADGAKALVEGDAEGIATAYEKGVKAGVDALAIATAAKGLKGGVKGPTVGGSISGGGAAALEGAFNPTAVGVMAGGGRVGVVGGVLGNAPAESKGPPVEESEMPDPDEVEANRARAEKELKTKYGKRKVTRPSETRAQLRARAFKEAGLPTKPGPDAGHGTMVYEPPKSWRPNQPLPSGPKGGFLDAHGCEWVRGPTRTAGEAIEWDVQVPPNRVQALRNKGVTVRSGNPGHVNVSLEGTVTH